MDHTMPVWGRAEEFVRPVTAAAAASLVSAPLVSPLVSALVSPLVSKETALKPTAKKTKTAIAGVTSADKSGEWEAWIAFVNGAGPFPLGSTQRIWSWILARYTPVIGSEIREIAYRWWYDKILKYDEQKLFIEGVAITTSSAASVIVDGAITTAAAAASVIVDGATTTTTTTTNQTKSSAVAAIAVDRDVYRSAELCGYRIFNPATIDVEYYRWDPREADPTITLCPPTDRFKSFLERS